MAAKVCGPFRKQVVRVLGPLDEGRLEFYLDGEPCALVIPDDGRLVGEWAASGNWARLMPGCVAEEYLSAVEARLADPADPMDLYSCWRLVHALSPSVYGVDWWVAKRLCATVDEMWVQFSSWAVTVGFTMGGATAHELCSAAVSWLMRSAGGEEKELRAMHRRIFDPPKDEMRYNPQQVQGFSKEDQAASFQAALSALGDGG